MPPTPIPPSPDHYAVAYTRRHVLHLVRPNTPTTRSSVHTTGYPAACNANIVVHPDNTGNAHNMYCSRCARIAADECLPIITNIPHLADN